MQLSDVLCLKVCHMMCEAFRTEDSDYYDFAAGFGAHKYVETEAGVRQGAAGGGQRTAVFLLRRRKGSGEMAWSTMAKVYHTTMRWVNAASMSSRLLIVGGGLDLHYRFQETWLQLAECEGWCCTHQVIQRNQPRPRRMPAQRPPLEPYIHVVCVCLIWLPLAQSWS